MEHQQTSLATLHRESDQRPESEESMERVVRVLVYDGRVDHLNRTLSRSIDTAYAPGGGMVIRSVIVDPDDYGDSIASIVAIADELEVQRDAYPRERVIE